MLNGYGNDDIRNAEIVRRDKMELGVGNRARMGSCADITYRNVNSDDNRYFYKF